MLAVPVKTDKCVGFEGLHAVGHASYVCHCQAPLLCLRDEVDIRVTKGSRLYDSAGAVRRIGINNDNIPFMLRRGFKNGLNFVYEASNGARLLVCRYNDSYAHMLQHYTP